MTNTKLGTYVSKKTGQEIKLDVEIYSPGNSNTYLEIDGKRVFHETTSQDGLWYYFGVGENDGTPKNRTVSLV